MSKIIYKHQDYRLALGEIVKEKKQKFRGFTSQKLAQAMKIQGSYLSRVLKLNAHLTPDQLELAGRFLEFSDPDLEFFLLLQSWAQSTSLERKKRIWKKIETRRSKMLSTTAAIPSEQAVFSSQDLDQYYLNPISSVIHMCLSIPGYQMQPKLIAEQLGLTPNQLQRALDQLENIGVIRRLGTHGYQSVKANLHLPSDSPLLRTHQQLMRSLASQYLALKQKRDTYNLAITFSGDEETKIKIRSRFLQFLKDADELIDRAPCKEVYQMNFDLFSWMD